MERAVYSGRLRLLGEEHVEVLSAAINCVTSLIKQKCFEEAKPLVRKSTPVAQRALGENNEITLHMRWIYARALYEDPDATLDDLREALTTLEDTVRIARRVLGGAHPLVAQFEKSLRYARAALRESRCPSGEVILYVAVAVFALLWGYPAALRAK